MWKVFIMFGRRRSIDYIRTEKEKNTKTTQSTHLTLNNKLCEAGGIDTVWESVR